MGVEWIAVGALLAAGALFAGFPVGVFVGYAWRNRISNKRRLLVAEERRRAEIDAALRAFALPEETKPAAPGVSDGAPAKAIEVKQPTVTRARKRTDAPAPDGKPPRQRAKKVKLTIVAGDDRQEPEQPGKAPKTPH
jgi:hypothetical protein